MKNILLLAVTLSLTLPAFGQTLDTTFITISQENAPLEKQQLVSPYDQVFGTLEPTRWLLKLNLAPLTGTSDDRLRASAEVKLSPAISLHGSYGIGYEHFSAAYLRSSSYNLTQRMGIEPRWYYAMPRRIRQGKSANNMSGNYIALEALYTRSDGRSDTYQFNNDQTSVALRYGLQRRLFRYGFLDIGFGLGALKQQGNNIALAARNTWRFFASSQIGLGLALARPKATAATSGYCDVLRCFREERQMWKIDLYNLLRINASGDNKGQISIGYERKLGFSPFSVEVQGEYSQRVVYSAFNETQRYENLKNGNGYGASLQSRYYYSQKQRIAKGKGGNNLSGTYVGAQLQWQEERDNYPGYYYGPAGEKIRATIFRETRQDLSSGLFWGIQHRLFQHGFIDFQVIGAYHQLRNTYAPSGWVNNISAHEFNVALKLRAGLAF